MRLDRPLAPGPYDLLPEVPTFIVRSDDVTDGQPLAKTFVHSSAGGEDISPHLQWSGFPAETLSFAVTCFDPDAPTHSGWWHWYVADIPASVSELPRGAGDANGAHLPAGAFHLANDYGTLAYGGSAPPQGDRPHRYFFAVHALDVTSLGISPQTSCAVGGFMITAHTIARGFVVPTYAH